MEEPTRHDVTALLGTSVEVVQGLRWRNDHFPEPGSSAHRAWVHVRQPHGSVAFHAYANAASQLGGAEDSIRAIELLLQEGEHSVASFVLARAVIEACGRAYVLLDPSLPEDERSALAVREKLEELHTLERLMHSRDPHGLDPAVQADLSDTRRRLTGLQDGARDAGLIVPRERPSFTRVVNEVLSLDENGTLATIAVAGYSSLAHAVPLMLVANAWRQDSSLGHEWGVGFSEPDYSQVVDLVVTIMLAYSRAVSRQIDAYDWPRSAWDRWVGHVRAVLRRAIRASQASEVTDL